MTEPTPRTVFIRGIELPLNLNHYPVDRAEGWEMLCRARYAIESLERALARRDLQVEAMRGELKLLQCANEAASFEQGLAERAGEIEAMREAIRRALAALNINANPGVIAEIRADLEQALNLDEGHV